MYRLELNYIKYEDRTGSFKGGEPGGMCILSIHIQYSNIVEPFGKT